MVVNNTMSLKYDNVRFEEMNEFLKKLLKYTYDYDEEQDRESVYRALCNYDIKEDDMNNDFGKEIELNTVYEWEHEFDSYSSGKKCHFSDRDKSFVHFDSWTMIEREAERLDDRKYIKLYISLDSDHLEKGVNELFNYIVKEKIMHCSKVAKHFRSDNIVIRIPQTEQDNAFKIIDFISNNQYIQEGLNKTNPFISTVNGVGYMEEEGISYNAEIANLIANYINDVYYEDENNVSINEFITWLNENINSTETLRGASIAEIKRIFDISVDSNNRDIEFIPRRENVLTNEKETMIKEAFDYTYDYGGFSFMSKDETKKLNHLKHAIERVILDREYGSFENGYDEENKYKKKLMINVSPEELKMFILKSCGKNFNITNEEELRTIIKEYMSIYQSEKTMMENTTANISAGEVVSNVVERMANGEDVLGEEDNQSQNSNNRQMGYTMIGLIGFITGVVTTVIIVLGIILTK